MVEFNRVSIAIISSNPSFISSIISSFRVFFVIFNYKRRNFIFENENSGKRTGEIIRQLRKQANLTQEQLGEVLGVKKSAIAKYENGRVENLKRITIEKLSDFFEVPPSTILGINAEDSEALSP